MELDLSFYKRQPDVVDYMKANRESEQASQLNDLKIKNAKQEYVSKALNITTPENYSQVRNTLVSEGLLDDNVAPKEYNEEWLNKAKTLFTGNLNRTIPSAVQEYQFFSQLSPQDKEQYLLTKRSNSPLNLGSYFAERSPVTNEITPIATIEPKLSEMPAFQQKQELAKAQGKAEGEIGAIPRKIIAEEEAKALTPDAIETSRKAEILKDETFNIINRLLSNKEGVKAASGTSAYLPSFTDKTLDAEADLETLRSMLTIENLGIMKGVLSETDMKVLQALSAGGLKGSDEQVIKNLEALAPKIQAEKLRRGNILKSKQRKLSDIVANKNNEQNTLNYNNEQVFQPELMPNDNLDMSGINSMLPQKTIVKTQISPSTGKKRIIYSDGSIEYQ